MDDGKIWLPNRRDLLLGAAVAFAGLAVGGSIGSAAARADTAGQPDWRFCGNCNGLFFSGANGNYYRQNQRCSAGGLHDPMGFNFVLPHDTAETATAQKDWRFCGNCNGLFFSGANGDYYRQNQRCSAGGLHDPMGFNFVLPHDTAETATAQKDWRFCGNCNGLFFSGANGDYYRQNQRCPAGGLHDPMGFNFVLPHQAAQQDSMTADERKIADAINSTREQVGCSGALQVDSRLVAVARAHSQDLADHPGPPGLWETGTLNRQGHTGSDGSQPGDRIAKAVGSPGTENVYVAWLLGGDPGPPVQGALNYWLENTPQHHDHRDNALNCAHKSTGVGISKGSGVIPQGQQNAGQQAIFYYFTQVFHD
ncbi:CAP domain-containing protein [Nocardia sp. CA-119907]|uniref:CAP domain-containing protein n=1 Tax=Nocardia sp. CA-119907 TaxID=3239973 RepID=UPI003D97AE30